MYVEHYILLFFLVTLFGTREDLSLRRICKESLLLEDLQGALRWRRYVGQVLLIRSACFHQSAIISGSGVFHVQHYGPASM